MRRVLSIISLVVCILCWTSPPCRAQFDEHVRRHVILSIDAKTKNLSSRRASLADTAVDLLFQGDSLLRKGDLLSIVNFAASTDDVSFTEFVQHAKSGSTSVIYHPVVDVNEIAGVLRRCWTDFATAHAPEKCYSLSSVAKPYSLKALPFQGEFTNCTYLILVTDQVPNGADYYQEVSNWIKESHCLLDLEHILKECHDVENEYLISYRQTHVASFGYSDKVYFTLYECCPHQTSLALPSVLSYDVSFEPVRVRGRKYRIDFEATPRQEAHFQVKRLDVSLKYSDGSSGETKSYYDGGMIKDSFYYKSGKKVDSLLIRAWVQLKDGFYDAVVLTPSPEAPSYLGRSGMNAAVPVLNAREAKIFRWRLPDWLWLFYSNDPFKCAFLWQLIFIALALLGVGLLFRSWKTYEPKKDQVHLH